MMNRTFSIKYYSDDKILVKDYLSDLNHYELNNLVSHGLPYNKLISYFNDILDPNDLYLNKLDTEFWVLENSNGYSFLELDLSNGRVSTTSDEIYNDLINFGIPKNNIN